MSLVSSIAAIAVGMAFVLAGASKLASGGSWPSQAAGLGAPRWTIPVVPWLELALGALLVVQLLRVPVAIAALLLLVVFTVLILHKLRRGEHPPCACFGAWSATPIGWGHVARNVALMALAVVAAI